MAVVMDWLLFLLLCESIRSWIAWHLRCDRGWLNVRPRGVYAFEGEEIVCPSGHVQGAFTRPVMTGEMYKGDAVKWRKGDEFGRLGRQYLNCQCGRAYFNGRIRFKDGWR